MGEPECEIALPPFRKMGECVHHRFLPLAGNCTHKLLSYVHHNIHIISTYLPFPPPGNLRLGVGTHLELTPAPLQAMCGWVWALTWS